MNIHEPHPLHGIHGIHKSQDIDQKKVVQPEISERARGLICELRRPRLPELYALLQERQKRSLRGQHRRASETSEVPLNFSHAACNWEMIYLYIYINGFWKFPELATWRWLVRWCMLPLPHVILLVLKY